MLPSGPFEPAAGEFERARALVGGEERELDALARGPLWGAGLYEPARFALVRAGGGSLLDQIPAAADRTLGAARVVEPCSMRWGTECAFRDMKRDARASSHRLWSKGAPRLERFAPSGAPDRLLPVEGERGRAPALAGAEAMARFAAAACVATGVPQVLALAEPEGGAVAYSEFRRAPQRARVSVRTARSLLAERVSSFIDSRPSSATARFTRERRAGPGGHAPNAGRRGRR